MKRILFSVTMMLSAFCAIAQFNTNLVVSANPPGTLIDWSSKTLTYIIINQSGAGGNRAIIKAELKTLDGAAVATTNLAKARVITIGGGSLVLGPTDVIPLEQMIFSGKYKTTLDRTGKLPADNYNLCVQLVTPTDYQPLSEVKCRNFTLAAFHQHFPENGPVAL